MIRLIFIHIILISLSVNSESDINTVKAEYGRCVSVMERVERAIRRYEEVIRILQGRSNNINGNINLTKEFTTLENRAEYFRNRYERAKSLSDKISSDLKEVKGPTCPSCIESSVNLYCRNSEILLNELEDYITKASDLNGKLIELEAQKKDAFTKSELSYESTKHKIDSMYNSLNICKDSVTEVLTLQIKRNISKADSIYKNKEVEPAIKLLKIAESLINKINKRCSDVK